MAKKKAAGAVKISKDSISKRRGVKVFGNQYIRTGQIIVRQLGTKFHPGLNVKRTSDDTLIALTEGMVTFTRKKVRAFTGNLVKRTFVNIIPLPKQEA
jgi:large subunit ribosomal protein L27